MTDCDSKSIELQAIIDVTMANITDLPEQLPGDPKRQAVSSISGTVYQAWWSIDAWLRLANADEVIYLEGSEDFEIVRTDSAITVQVKRNEGTISLGNAKALAALENFWTLSCREVHRQIDFHYLTTSSIAKEQDSNFGDLKGIEVWRAAQTNSDLAMQVSAYVVTKLDVNSPLRLFLSSETPQMIQERLIKRFRWLTDQQDIDAMKKSVDDRITILLSEQRHSLALIPNVRKNIESRFWEILIETSSAKRCLTRAELLRQVEAATVTYVPVPVGQLPILIGNARPGFDLLNLLSEKSPKPPEPLLLRRALTQRLEELVNHRKVVLLTGTVYKGKTTIAQLVCSTLCPEAWWINLTERKPNEVDNVFLALSSRIESVDCPGLVVIDDLDISPTAHRAYRDSLELVLHRANTTGCGILITARGASSDSAVVQDFKSIELVNVPELSSTETAVLCIENGCPEKIATPWGELITSLTRGHPKLVQVRLAELAARGWPKPGLTDITTPSSAIISVRTMARQLLSDSVSGPIAEFVYLISECSILLHRSVAIRLAEAVKDLTNGGDILDSLTGKWLERIEGQWYRTTSLLKGVAHEVWSPKKFKLAHICLYDAILTKKTLDQFEVSALIFHAFIGGDSSRLANTALRLQTLKDSNAQHEIERNLLWLPYVALDPGKSIVDDPLAAAILRSLQYRVALTLDSDCLPQICERWSEDIEKIKNPAARAVNRSVMNLFTSFTQNPKVPLKIRLAATKEIPDLPIEISKQSEDINKYFFENANGIGGLPEKGTTAQVILYFANICVRDLVSLDELLHWLDNVATEDIRKQFDEMLEWPLVQDLGAFVQGAWSAVHEQTKDWEPWLVLFERVNDYAKRRGSHRFGSEAAKARATILTEYLDRDQDALKVLDSAETDFGQSVVLMEQRANVFFQTKNDESVLDIWNHLSINPNSSNFLNPYAYRRIGMSAARLKRWDEAEIIFSAAAASIQPGTYEVTKFGLRVDAALSVSLKGDQVSAAIQIADAILELPAEAAKDGDARWEAVQRAAAVVRKGIENSLWMPSEAKIQLEPGFASAPDLKVPKVELGQAARSELTRAQSLHLVSTLAKDSIKYTKELEILANSRHFSVRWIAAESRLAQAYSAGAGGGFVEALLAFDRATAEWSANMQKGMSILIPDDGQRSNFEIAPQRWFGLLCAGVVCSSSNLLDNLRTWLDASIRLLGEDAALTNNIRLLLKGASLSTELLHPTIIDSSFPPSVRCGAAAKMLRDGIPAEKTYQLQVFLTSALVCDDSFARQQLFNCHIARNFADAWRLHAQRPFQFCSPRYSVPALLEEIDKVERGSGTLKSLIVTAASALGKSLEKFIERVL